MTPLVSNRFPFKSGAFPIMRVGVVALLHESNTFIQAPTTPQDFENDLLVIGLPLVDQLRDMHHELGGMLTGLDEQGMEIVPLVATRAMPFGPISADAWDALTRMIFQQLEIASPLDGLLAALHGAAVSEAILDADGWLLAELRRNLGPDKPLIATLDPHANVSPRMVQSADALIAYRTNPHLDQRERGFEAARLIARTIRREVQPVIAASFPPLAINIERQCTGEPHWQPMEMELEAVRDRDDILSASLILGFPYADVPEMGAGIIVVADGDRDVAKQQAEHLGGVLWEHREAFVPELLGIEEGVEQAMALEGPICLLDMGDNVGGGSPGDGTLLAHALRDCQAKGVVVLYDPEGVQQAVKVGPGGRVRMAVGGKTDDMHGSPLEDEFLVKGIHDGKFEEPEPRHGGLMHCDQGLSAVVTTDRGLTVLLTSLRMPPFSLRQLTSCGIFPMDHHILVAKGVNAPLAAYREVCLQFLRIDTPGVTTANLDRLIYQHRRRPMYPFERETEWTPESEEIS
jgi:microcystin degradation protein MlrC